MALKKLGDFLDSPLAQDLLTVGLQSRIVRRTYPVAGIVGNLTDLGETQRCEPSRRTFDQISGVSTPLYTIYQ